MVPRKNWAGKDYPPVIFNPNTAKNGVQDYIVFNFADVKSG
jgi:hypothetical protein